MTKGNDIPAELEHLLEKRDSKDRRKRKVHVARERRTGKDRRDESSSKKK